MAATSVMVSPPRPADAPSRAGGGRRRPPWKMPTAVRTAEAVSFEPGSGRPLGGRRAAAERETVAGRDGRAGRA
ncbi:hypothetical protein [Streptomyces fagopyri]|uniref:hypothetical protein n=1 Tax=Streptomyces fagopyri TaxID=2662397 RepID=UPI00371AC5BB